MIITEQIELLSDGHFNVLNITDQVVNFVQDSGIQNGQTLWCSSSTQPGR
jgi:thiamine phosphate synthase YjbQ (UPF0047 family)